MKKSKGMATLFAMLPGAGHMYLGLTRQGIELMLIFFITIFLSSEIGLHFLEIFLPVIWFYSVFDARTKSTSDEPLQDSDLKIFSGTVLKDNFSESDNFVKCVGIFLIIAGAWAALNNLIFPIVSKYIDYSIIYDIKSAFISLIFIGAGVFLLFKKRKALCLKAGERNCKEEE